MLREELFITARREDRTLTHRGAHSVPAVLVRSNNLSCIRFSLSVNSSAMARCAFESRECKKPRESILCLIAKLFVSLNEQALCKHPHFDNRVHSGCAFYRFDPVSEGFGAHGEAPVYCMLVGSPRR